MTKRLIGIVLFIASVLPTHAQGNFSDALRQKVKGNVGGALSVDLSFNQPVYSPGDTAFFLVTVWDFSANKPDAGRQIIDINLWNESGAAEISLRSLVFGTANSQFKLPAKLKPGRYKLTGSFYQSDIVQYQREFTVVADWELTGATSIQKPVGESQGFAIHVVKDEIEIRRRDAPGGAGYYLMLTGKSGAELVKKINLSDSVSRVAIPQEVSGVVQASILDENYKVWASRWVQRSKSASSSTPTISIDKATFTTREKVQVKISGPSVTGQATVRVIKKDLFQKYFETTFRSTSNSTLATLAPQPIQGLSEQPIKPTEKFLTIAGEAVYSDTGKPLPDSTVLVLFLQNKLFGYETMVKGGRFKVPLVFDVDGDETVFFSASFRKRDLNNFAVKLEGTIAVKPMSALRAEATEKQDAYGQYTIRKNVIDRSFRYFAGPAGAAEIDPNAKYIEELSGVDITVEPRQYVTFATMSEVIREILPSLEHRTVKDREIIRLYTTHKRPSNFANPLFIIDGVLTKNAGHFLDIAPADVLYIKIVKDYSKLRHFGLLGDNGIIIVRTRLVEPAFEQENVFPIEGMTAPVQSRIYSGNSVANPKIPDLRPCLYWNPKAKFDDDHVINVSFSTSDDVGDYIIQVFGRDANGEPFVAEQAFGVNVNK